MTKKSAVPALSPAAKRIDKLVQRAHAKGKAASTIGNSKVEAYVTLVDKRTKPYYAKRTEARVYFRCDGNRIAKFDLLAYLDELL